MTVATEALARPDVGRYAVGVDVGGTKLLAVLLADGEVVARHRSVTGTGAEAVADGVAASVRAVLAEAGIAVGDVGSVGIGVPGVVDPATGTVSHAVNLGFDDAAPLGDLVSERLGGIAVKVDNDLNVAVVGAAALLARAGEPADDIAFVALGTGLAAGMLMDGEVRRGSRGAAGEIGHLRYVPDGRPCKCGQYGCLERYASGSAIDATWPSTDGRPAPVVLFEAAAAGDAEAVRVRDEFVAAVASTVRILVLTCDFERIVIGGGVSELGAPLLDALVAELDRQALASPFLATTDMARRVRLAPAGVPVGAVGAAVVGRGEA